MRTFIAFAFFIALTSSLPSFASTDDAGDAAVVQACLRHWKTAPFNEHSDFRTIGAQVRVFGIGSEIVDEGHGSKPELVFVKPNVTVMSKTTMKLLNPHGWYCLKANVSVMGKTQIDLGCGAHLASSKDGTNVLGADDTDGSVAVMGSARINRVGKCAQPDSKSDDAAPAKKSDEKAAKSETQI